jgi:RNA polymerase sigma factor (sigma-70 family)
VGQVLLTKMPPPVPEQLSSTIETLYRSESGRVLATLVRLLGDLDLAEEAMHEAFAAALESWPQTGIPDRPRPWLISTARFKAIDTPRRRARFDASQDELARYLEAQWSSAGRSNEEDSLEDDRLRLIFTCCHPSLAPEAHVALTLREVCGLTTEEIAKAFLITPRTLAQRIVRAKAHASPVASEALQRVATRMRSRRRSAVGRRFRAGVVCFSFILSTQHIRSPAKRWVRVTLTSYRLFLTLARQRSLSKSDAGFTTCTRRSTMLTWPMFCTTESSYAGLRLLAAAWEQAG